MKERIVSHIQAECPWRDTLYWFDSIDSTNTKAKELARQGAPHGTVLIAGTQTGGRGRMGRSFSSPEGKGIYLSVILRPQCAPNQLMHLTCAVGVAMCQAIEYACGLQPGIKWINDLVYEKRKLGGILTELAVDPANGLTDYAIVGIGINCLQKADDFPAEIQNMAASLAMFAEGPVDCAAVTGSMVNALWKLDQILFSQKESLMACYRQRCVTLGQAVCVHRNETRRYGKAMNVDDEGALEVQYDDGCKEWVSSGEVSVRGLYGYV